MLRGARDYDPLVLCKYGRHSRYTVASKYKSRKKRTTYRAKHTKPHMTDEMSESLPSPAASVLEENLGSVGRAPLPTPLRVFVVIPKIFLALI
jgi:hypothetical protein